MVIVLFNYVATDGKGDFSHLIDIYSALRKTLDSKGIKIILIVHTSLYPTENFEQQLKTLNIDEYFITNATLEKQHSISNDIQLQTYLSEAIQIFLISYQSFRHNNLIKYINPSAITKYIGEHEAEDQYGSSIFKISRSMGLSKGKYGIKLNSQKKSLQNCLVNESDLLFLETLLKATNSVDIDSFKQNYLFAPAYFNETPSFFKFLLFISSNESLNNHNMAIFFSGNLKLLEDGLNDIFAEKDISWSIQSYFINSDIKKIEIINSNKSSKTYLINNSGSKNIKIFGGFFLSDELYNHIYQWAFIAGVSGDNTLEKAISNKVLPYYCSTNFGFKKPTLRALQAISKQITNNENSLASEFDCYFDAEKFECYNHCFYNSFDQYFYIFKKINLKDLIDNWNKIADYLIEHYNFYDKLPGIFYEGLDTRLINQTNSNEHKRNFLENDNSKSSTMEYNYSQISDWFAQDTMHSQDKITVHNNTSNITNRIN